MISEPKALEHIAFYTERLQKPKYSYKARNKIMSVYFSNEKMVRKGSRELVDIYKLAEEQRGQ
jgi:hypothetical protein